MSRSAKLFRNTSGGSSAGALLIAIIVVIAALAIGYSLFGPKKEQSRKAPPGVAKNLPTFERPSTPEPATPAPKPKPTAASAIPPAEPDAVAWLRADKSRWPEDVRLMEAADFPATLNGRVVGSVKVPAGTSVQLVELTGDSIGVFHRGGGARLAITATDLRERAKQAMAKAATEPVATAALAKTSPHPATPKSPPENPFPTSGSLVPTTISGSGQTVASLIKRRVTLTGRSELRVTGAGDPLEGSVFNFTSPDAWLFLEKLAPSFVASKLVSRMWVNGEPAAIDKNLRVTRYEAGTLVIPHGSDFPALTVFTGKSATGTSQPLQCYVAYNDAALGPVKGAISSFRLKRGYMATLAEQEDGTGVSRNYVAQDHDIEVAALPPELDKKVRFIRIFPWRWVSKKGVAGGIWQNLNVGWYYDWNIGQNSTSELEYVPIRQKRGWPSLKQDWKDRGSTHLLGFNEPDQKDQANLTVDEAIAGWSDLLRTGLRLGSPATTDGGSAWLYQFLEKADAAKLRVDFVAVHYYRAVPNPGNAKAAATQFYNYLKGIHDRVKRPLWVTEWNNGANWTKAPDPTYQQEKEAVEEMIKMLDKTPFVERYAIYNWVEDVRNVQRKDGSLTPAGEVYRDKVSPVSYMQVKY